MGVLGCGARASRLTPTYVLLAQVKQRWRGTVEVINAGSSLKFCRIAEGLADFYPRLAPTSEWDTAAAQAVLSAAGGSVVSATANEHTGFSRLVYNQRDTALNPDFYALGDADFDWVALLKG
jgi:3'(2'), 5'-bisphosphate nucleotidase